MILGLSESLNIVGWNQNQLPNHVLQKNQCLKNNDEDFKVKGIGINYSKHIFIKWKNLIFLENRRCIDMIHVSVKVSFCISS
jgi:hypothetical protein